MALKACKECKASVSDSAVQCPHCGVLFPCTPDSEIKSGIWKFIISMFRTGAWTILIIGIAALWLMPIVYPSESMSIVANRVGQIFILFGAIALIIGESTIFLLRRRNI